MQKKLCLYYQANVERANTWFLAATLRSFEHLAFDRSLQKETGLFEFYVPQNLEPYFLELMDYYQQEGIVSNFQKLQNRLADDSTEL